jgi:hypothetical protein
VVWTFKWSTRRSCSAQGFLSLVAVVLAYGSEPTIAQISPVATNPVAASAQEPHPIDPALMLARESWQHSQAHVRDYTAIMAKRIRVEGVLGEYQYAFVKIRNRRAEGDRITTPMSVYMKFLKPSAINGREVIWVEGRNKGRLVVHEVGIKNLFRVNLDPNGAIAMRGQRYPITEIGLDKLLLQMIDRGSLDRQHGECQVDFYQNAKVNKRSCQVVQIVHPVQRPHFSFHRAQVFFDDELKLPVRYASWSWPTEPGSQPPLEEEYNYTDIKINVGLADLDFDPDNAEYNY